MHQNQTKISQLLGHKKLTVTLLIVFCFVVLLPILALGYMGLVPGVSNLMGASTPRDLGVKYTEKDISQYEYKTRIQFKDYAQAPIAGYDSSEKQLLANPVTVNGLKLTDQELTGAINNLDFAWLPLNQMQVKTSPPNLEISGKIDTAKIKIFRNYLDQNGMNNSDIDNFLSWAQKFSNNAPFYVSAYAEMSDNNVIFKLNKAEIGRLEVPLGSLSSDLKNYSSNDFYFDNTNISTASIHDGYIVLSGTYPSVIYLKK